MLQLGVVLLMLLSAPSLRAASESGQQEAPVPMTAGEVIKIEKGAGKLTLRHGPILNLDMQGMTMAFRVSDPAMLDTLQVGDAVRFVAERVNGVILLTRIEK